MQNNYIAAAHLLWYSYGSAENNAIKYILCDKQNKIKTNYIFKIYV